ncbi:FtsK/SpoIIIE domain-containing protein [Streptomyces sp. NPDC005349]|uniref:FtsK/SpoIIIE domain-containing protein n=1 Tax=Streptomyces sp. NPDC005349 TaxID=3157037 RepID=UPI0033A26C7C
MSATTAAKKKQADSGPVLDWSAGHGPVTGALSATTGALAIATTGAALSMPPAWALAVGGAGALGHTVAGLKVRNAGRTLAFKAASWLVGAGWTTWAMTTGPLSWAALGSLATIGVGMGAGARSVALYEEAREEEALAAEQRQVAREVTAERRAIAAAWVERIQRICNVTVKVLAVEMWESGNGYSLDLEPQGGTTYDRLAQHGPALSADAKLPHGCTAAFGPGVDQGRAILDVTSRNVLSEARTYPEDYRPLSILTGIPWGFRTNGDDVLAYLREQCALVVGPTGSGKTNILHTILAGFARTTDVLTFVIDLNAGSAGLPWVLPALNGELTQDDGKPVRPGIDWLAGTYEEALKLLDAAIAIGLHRKRAYQELMAKHDTDLLPVSAKIPQIMLVIDEGAEILVSTDRRMKELAKRILEFIRMQRAMGGRTVITALGATGSVLGNLIIRREAKIRVALTGGETEGMDLSKMFPGRKGLRVDQAPFKGAGFMGTPESPGALFKAWRIKPSQIRDITIATSDRHPRLDAVSAKAAGADYARRWDADRTAWMRDLGPETGTEEPASTSGSGLNLSAHRADQTAKPSTDDDLMRRFREEIDAQFATAPDPDAPPATPANGLNLSALRDADGDGPDWLPDAIVAIKEAGRAGMKPSAVAEKVSRSRQAVRKALKDAAERGELVYQDNGPHSVYVHPEHA